MWQHHRIKRTVGAENKGMIKASMQKIFFLTYKYYTKPPPECVLALRGVTVKVCSVPIQQRATDSGQKTLMVKTFPH